MINTNGFITKYIKECGEITRIENEITRIEEHLAPMYAEIDALHNRYDAHAKIDEQTKLQVEKRHRTYSKEFFYFRSIIDGLYNLLEEFGWNYQSNLFEHLIQFAITATFEENFYICYNDEIKNTIDIVFSHEHRLIPDKEYIVFEDCDTFSSIKMPIDLDIEEVLISSQNLLKELHKLDNEKQDDEEYKTYLRLKKKYENK